MQTLAAQYFRYNSHACTNLRGFPPIPLKMSILQHGGRGYRPAIRHQIGKRTNLLRWLDQPVVLLQHLLQFGVRNGIDLEVVDALHGLGGDQGVDHRFLH